MAFPLSGLVGPVSRFLIVPSLLSSLIPSWGSRVSPIPPNNQLSVTHSWSQLDFHYPSSAARKAAIESEEFIQENIVPYGMDVWEDRVFITIPKLRAGVPATLATVPRSSETLSPKLDPYPNWDFYTSRTGCDGIISVFRVATDPCGRLWVLDSGKVDVAFNITEVCPPQLFVFDMADDRLLRRYVFPANQTLADNLLINIVVDYQGDCQDVFAYIADTARYNLLVYSYKNRTSWKINHGSFYPDPMTFSYRIDQQRWYWNYGIVGLALGPNTTPNDRKLYYHAGSSYKEFAVPTSVLKDPQSIDENRSKFMLLGQRGYTRSHASGSAISRSGVMFYGLPEHHIAGCWDTNNTGFSSMQQGIIGMDKNRLAFPNDIKVDHEKNQSVWILNNDLHNYLYGKMNFRSTNYHILRGNTESAVRRTVCSPNFTLFQKFKATNTSVDYDTTSVRTVTEPADPRSEEPPKSTEPATESAGTTEETITGNALTGMQTSSQAEDPATSIPIEADSQAKAGELITTTMKLPATSRPTPIQPTTTPTPTTSTKQSTTTDTPTTIQEKTTTESTRTITPEATRRTTTGTTTTTSVQPTAKATTNTATEQPVTTTTTPQPETEAPSSTLTTSEERATSSPENRQRNIAPRTTTSSPATQEPSTTSSTTARNSLMGTAEKLMEDCKDLPIGPEGMRPCRLLDLSRNTVNRMLSNTPLGDVLNNPDSAVNIAVSDTVNNTINMLTNNPVADAVNNTVNLITNNPVSNIVNNNPITNGLRRVFGGFFG